MNPKYMVTITSVLESPGTPHISVQAPMPDTFMFDTAVEYSAPFTQGLTNHEMIDTAMRVAFASKLVTHSMTAQFWQGSSRTELGVELEFQAESDARAEVIEPIMQLLKLATPTINSAGMLASPGPKLDGQIGKDLLTAVSGENLDVPGEVSNGSLTDTSRSSVQGGGGMQDNSEVGSVTIGTVDYWKSRIKDQISIQIGEFAFFDSVVINSVQKTYESQFDAESGLPFYAKVAVRFTPLFMLVQSDLDKIFGSKRPASRALPDRDPSTGLRFPPPTI